MLTPMETKVAEAVITFFEVMCGFRVHKEPVLNCGKRKADVQIDTGNAKLLVEIRNLTKTNNYLDQAKRYFPYNEDPLTKWYEDNKITPFVIFIGPEDPDRWARVECTLCDTFPRGHWTLLNNVASYTPSEMFEELLHNGQTFLDMWRLIGCPKKRKVLPLFEALGALEGKGMDETASSLAEMLHASPTAVFTALYGPVTPFYAAA